MPVAGSQQGKTVLLTFLLTLGGVPHLNLARGKATCNQQRLQLLPCAEVGHNVVHQCMGSRVFNHAWAAGCASMQLQKGMPWCAGTCASHWHVPHGA